MEDELIYDTSLLNHATLTTLVQKSPLWRGPFCFEEMLTTLRLFYAYLTPLKMCSYKERSVLQFRFKTDYSSEENIWGIVEAYKRLLGIITFAQCQISDDLRSALEDYKSQLTTFKSTLASGLLVFIIHNESQSSLRFNEISETIVENVEFLKKASLELPNFCEVVVLPGNGFIDEQCCVQKDVGNRCAYYQFSPALDSSLRGALMREGQYLHLTISRQLEVCLENSNSPPQPVSFIVPPVVGKALSFTGRLPVSVVGVSLEEEIQTSEVGRDTPAKLRSVLEWGRQENSTQERRQKICRINKLLGDLSVQLGNFDVGHWHYRNAIRFSSSTDPAIWQSATLVGIGASIYLREIDVLGKHRFFEVSNSEQCSQRLRPSERLSPILGATGIALKSLIKPKLSINLVDLMEILLVWLPGTYSCERVLTFMRVPPISRAGRPALELESNY